MGHLCRQLANGRELLIIAVPTFGARGRTTGVLAGSIVIKNKPESKQAVDLGFGDLSVIDRNGRMLLTGLVVFAAGSLVTVLTDPSGGWDGLRIGRIVQDLGAEIRSRVQDERG